MLDFARIFAQKQLTTSLAIMLLVSLVFTVVPTSVLALDVPDNEGNVTIELPPPNAPVTPTNPPPGTGNPGKPQPPGQAPIVIAPGTGNPTPGPGTKPGNPGNNAKPLKITFGYGSNVWAWRLSTNTDRALRLSAEAGMNWVRQQVRWDYVERTPGNYDWVGIDELVAAAQRQNVKLLVSLTRSPKWVSYNGGLPGAASEWQSFVSKMAARYKSKIAAYEIWNEPNMAYEAGTVSVSSYVATLKTAYRAIKTADPAAIVVTGGTTPTGVNVDGVYMDDVRFVEECYKYNNGEWKKYFDALGVHPGGHGNSPDEFYPQNAPADKDRQWADHPSFFFRRFENQREVMVRYGDSDKQIWLTEFGWTTKNSAPGYGYGEYNTEQEQADYLVRAFKRGKNQYNYIGAMFVWNLNFSTVVAANDEKAPWSLLRKDWSPRLAYEAIKKMTK